MSLNQYVTRQEVLDGVNAAFQSRFFLFEYANTALTNRTQTYSLQQYGNGLTVQVRKRPVTRGTLTNISTLNGPFVKNIQFVEQETIDVTVDQLFNSTFELNAVNQKLFLNGKSADDETVYAATDNLYFLAMKHFYDNLILNANILALSPQTSLNTQNTLGKINVVALKNNMPRKACLFVSVNAANDLRSHFGVYLNDKASTPALSNRLPDLGYFSEIASDNIVEKQITGTAVNSSVTPVLSVAALNGDIVLTFDFTAANAGLTIKVGDPLTSIATDIFAVARGTYQTIGADINQPSFIAADVPTGVVNPDFTPPVLDINGIITTVGFYTVPVGGILTISIGQKVATTGNFQTIISPTSTLPIGTPFKFYDDHFASFMVADTGISFASPKITPIENATNTYSDYNDLNLRYATQGVLLNETNIKELASIWGSGYDSFYLIRVMSNN